MPLMILAIIAHYSSFAAIDVFFFFSASSRLSYADILYFVIFFQMPLIVIIDFFSRYSWFRFRLQRYGCRCLIRCLRH